MEEINSWKVLDKAGRCKQNCICILFTCSFIILIKPNVIAHYDYCNILLYNICIYLIFSDFMYNILIVSS